VLIKSCLSTLFKKYILVSKELFNLIFISYNNINIWRNIPFPDLFLVLIIFAKSCLIIKAYNENKVYFSAQVFEYCKDCERYQNRNICVNKAGQYHCNISLKDKNQHCSQDLKTYIVMTTK
jgi:hypothetical protein